MILKILNTMNLHSANKYKIGDSSDYTIENYILKPF